MIVETDYAGRAGERVLEGGSCDEVTEAAAVVLALALDPEAALSSLSEAEAELGQTPAVDSPRVATDDTSSTSAADPEDETAPSGEALSGEPLSGEPLVHGGYLGGGGVFGAGQVPGTALGARLDAGLVTSFGSAGLALNYYPGHTDRLLSPAEGRVHFKRFEAELELCLSAYEWGRLRASLCGHGQSVWLLGESRNISDPNTTRTYWFGLGAAMNAQYVVSEPWSLLAGVAASGALHQESFVIDGVGEVYETALWAFRANLGVRWSL
jgi:hypothetical protein